MITQNIKRDQIDTLSWLMTIVEDITSTLSYDKPTIENIREAESTLNHAIDRIYKNELFHPGLGKPEVVVVGMDVNSGRWDTEAQMNIKWQSINNKHDVWIFINQRGEFKISIDGAVARMLGVPLYRQNRR